MIDAAASRRLSDYSSSFRLEELDVELEDGRVLALTLKHLSWDAMLPGAHAVRRRDEHDAAREVAVYQHLLPGGPPGPPRYFGTTPDHAWLLLERVPGLQLRHVGEADAWRAAVDWLAAFHARSAPLGFRLPGWTSGPVRPGFEHAAERLAHTDRAVIHGQAYPANVVVDRTAGLRVAFVDWETAAIGPVAVDLAALTEGAWSESERDELLAEYLVARHGRATSAAVRELALDVRCARIVLALALVDLPRDVIPDDMSADWLGLAARLVEEVPG